MLVLVHYIFLRAGFQRLLMMELSLSGEVDMQKESEAVEENARAIECISSGINTGDALVVLDNELGYGIMKAIKRDKYVCFLHPCNGQTVKWSLFDLNCHRQNKHFPPVGPVPGRRRGKKPTGKWPVKSSIAAEHARQKERRDLKRKLDRQENTCKRRLIKEAMVTHGIRDVGDLSPNVRNDIEAAFAKYKSTRGEREHLTRAKIELAVQLEEAAKHQLVQSKNRLCKCCWCQKEKEVLTQADTIMTSCEVEKKRKCIYVCGKPEAGSSQRMLIPVQSVLESDKQSNSSPYHPKERIGRPRFSKCQKIQERSSIHGFVLKTTDATLEDAVCNVPIIELEHAEEGNSTHIEEQEEDCPLALPKDDSINQVNLVRALIPGLGSSIFQFPFSHVHSMIATPSIQVRLTAPFSMLCSLFVPSPLQGVSEGLRGISVPFRLLSDMTLPRHDHPSPPLTSLIRYKAKTSCMQEMEVGDIVNVYDVVSQEEEDLCVPHASVITMLLKTQVTDLSGDSNITENDWNKKKGNEKMLANNSDETQESLVSTDNLELPLAQKSKGIEDEDMVVVVPRFDFSLADQASEIVEQCSWDSQTSKESYIHHFPADGNWNGCGIGSKSFAEGEVQEHKDQVVSCIRKQNSDMLPGGKLVAKRVRTLAPENAWQEIGSEALASKTTVTLCNSQTLKIELRQSLKAAFESLDYNKRTNDQPRDPYAQLFQAKEELKGLTGEQNKLSEDLQQSNQNLDHYRHKCEQLEDLRENFVETKADLRSIILGENKVSKEVQEMGQDLNKKKGTCKKFMKEFGNTEGMEDNLYWPTLNDKHSKQSNLEQTKNFRHRSKNTSSFEGSLKTLKKQAKNMLKLLKQLPMEELKIASNDDDTLNSPLCIDPWAEYGKHQI